MNLRLILILTLVAGAPAYAEEVIQIGAILPLTGTASWWGENSKNGINLAVNDINAEGGVNGKKLEVVLEDGKCSAKDALAALLKLASADSIKYFIGEACSSASMAIAPIAQQKKIVMISPCSEANDLTKAGDYVFRTWTPNGRQGARLARYLLDLKLTKAAVVGIENEFAEPVIKAFVEDFEKGGGKISLMERYAPDTRDFRSVITRIKSSKPDAILMVVYPPDGIAFVTQLREQKVNVPLLSTSTINSESEFIGPLRGKIEGLVFTDTLDSTTESYRKRYEETFNVKWPGAASCPGTAYDAVRILADAIRKSGGDAAKTRDALAATRDYAGVSGNVTFTDSRDLDREHVLYQIRNGGPVVMEKK